MSRFVFSVAADLTQSAHIVGGVCEYNSLLHIEICTPVYNFSMYVIPEFIAHSNN